MTWIMFAILCWWDGNWHYGWTDGHNTCRWARRWIMFVILCWWDGNWQRLHANHRRGNRLLRDFILNEQNSVKELLLHKESDKSFIRIISFFYYLIFFWIRYVEYIFSWGCRNCIEKRSVSAWRLGVDGSMLSPNRVIARNVKRGVTHYYAHLGLSDQGRAKKGLSALVRMLVPTLLSTIFLWEYLFSEG